MSSLPETQRSRGNLILPRFSSFQDRRFPPHSKPMVFQIIVLGQNKFSPLPGETFAKGEGANTPLEAVAGPRRAVDEFRVPAPVKKRYRYPKKLRSADQEGTRLQAVLLGNRTRAGQAWMRESCLKGASQKHCCHHREGTGNFPVRAPESYWENKKTDHDGNL